MNGERVTRQRLAILEAVFDSEEHFSAEALHRRLRGDHLDISLATVYRTVNMLVEGGFLSPLDAGDPGPVPGRASQIGGGSACVCWIYVDSSGTVRNKYDSVKAAGTRTHFPLD